MKTTISVKTTPLVQEPLETTLIFVSKLQEKVGIKLHLFAEKTKGKKKVQITLTYENDRKYEIRH